MIPDQKDDNFTQESVLAKMYSFRGIFLNRISNVETKPAIILTMARVRKDCTLLTGAVT